jgi:penicillin-binding protein 2
VISSAALQLKRIGSQTRYNCTGSYILGKGKFDCWKEGGHGQQNVTDALMNSCNVFFYNTGKALGVDNIEEYARIFGLGKKTGIDLPDEASGIVPGRMWKKIHRKDSWYEGETINYAIGQGYLLVTPIQILEMMSVVANKGELVKPFVVKRIGSEDTVRMTGRKINIDERVIRIVREGLYKVVNGENGTGKRARVEGLTAAGKTGTAQNPLGRTHAWFSAFAPFDNPRLCLVVFLEHGGKGGLQPSEIAKGIFEEAKNRGYFNN